MFSSLVTGILTGVVAGAVAAVLSRLVIGRQRAAEQPVEKVWRPTGQHWCHSATARLICLTGEHQPGASRGRPPNAAVP